jgi:hypothetical protein
MDPRSHYALLVAINRYPGLSNLAGPENDADALARWLLDPAGGGLAAAHLKIIKSSDFPAVAEPYDAQPADTQIKKALNGWLKQDGQWRDRVGERLYLFFAGHGFTAGSLEDPALFTARAQIDDREYIAALRYARKIAVAGFFDEIVLVMDCCQDVLKATAIQEPAWSPPDRQADARVRMMRAFGAPRGQKAFETPPPADGRTDAPPVHGFFSHVFLDALRSAPADAEGWVTARAVEARFGELWTERYLAATGYEPPFAAPKDMRLYRRAPVEPARMAGGAGAGGAGAAPDAAKEAASASPLESLRAPAGSAKPRATGAAGSAPRSVAGRPLEQLTVPAGAHLATPDLGATVRVFDGRNRPVLPRRPDEPLQLAGGDYVARVRVGPSVKDYALRVEPADATPAPGGAAGRKPPQAPPPAAALPAMAFASPMPAAWSATHHEFHMGPALHLLRQSVPADPLDGQATLLVFARDSAHTGGSAWRMDPALRRGLRLLRLPGSGGAPEPLPVDLQVDAGGAFSTFTRHQPGGTCLLGVKRRLRERWVWDEMVLHLAAGWRTEVWLDAVDDGQDGRRFDLESASVRIVRRDRAAPLEEASGRQTELLSNALADRLRSPGTTPAGAGGSMALPGDMEALGPMGVLLAATLMTRAAAPDAAAVDAAAQWLAQAWNPTGADVAALRRWVAQHAAGAQQLLPQALPADAVPMLATSWALLAGPPGPGALSLPVQRTVGCWRVASDLWVLTQRPDDEAAAAAPPPGPAAPLPRLADGRPDLRRVTAALARPPAALSPLHQALRAALMDAQDEDGPGALDAVPGAVAATAGLGQAVVLEALQDLWQAASARTARRG